MTTTVSDVVSHSPLGIVLLTSGYAGVGIDWVHSSDLDDPSPFLEPGQALLTTGRQFTPHENTQQYDAYVARLMEAGVVAVGFGTEVLRSGTPPELIAACESAGLALFEVPYATPFIAVSKFVADRRAAQARQQLEWALGAQEAISQAVLGSGGLAAAVRSAGESLDCRVAVLDTDGVILDGTAPKWLRDRAHDLLRRGSRARLFTEDENGSWFAQTLGRSGRLLGAVAAVRPTAFSSAETSVLTMLSALTELALEHTEDQRLGFRAIAQQLLRLLRDGRVDAVRQALAQHPMQLPAAPFQVLAIDDAEMPASVRDSLERMAAGPARRLFAVEQGECFLLLVDGTSLHDVAARLAEAGLRGGLSLTTGWSALEDAMTQAKAALDGAPTGSLMTYETLMTGSVFGLLAEPRVAEIAQMRLAVLLASEDGRLLLREAAVWLSHGGAWEPAGRQLGLHRHTLKKRIEDLGNELELPLEKFPGRAELWAMLVSAGITTDIMN